MSAIMGYHGFLLWEFTIVHPGMVVRNSWSFPSDLSAFGSHFAPCGDLNHHHLGLRAGFQSIFWRNWPCLGKLVCFERDRTNGGHAYIYIYWSMEQTGRNVERAASMASIRGDDVINMIQYRPRGPICSSMFEQTFSICFRPGTS